ncbi:MAG: hypothetical protein KAS32_07370 [Candidatus Peribacteraceae bacterium]|nr:hypothetical protein [Candidatus Peribacteraceae bacterium]
MDGIWLFVYGLLALATKATVALFILFRMLKYANKANNVSIEEMLEKLNEDPRAVSDYYGRRLIAAAIVVLGVSVGSI